MLHLHGMSKKTAIYVLFKEYPDPAGRGKSASYIQDSAEYLVDTNALLQDWTELFDVLSFFSYERANYSTPADTRTKGIRTMCVAAERSDFNGTRSGIGDIDQWWVENPECG